MGGLYIPSTGLVIGVRGGLLTPDDWTSLPSIYAVRLRGTGTVTIEIKTVDGTIRSGGDPLVADGTPRTVYVSFGEDAEFARATLTGTATAEVY